MGKQRSASCKEAAHRAWRLLRLALIWARKGGLLKCRVLSELRQGAKYLTGGLHHKRDNMDVIWYGERQLSFDETPIIRFPFNNRSGRHGSTSLRFLIPCIKPDHVVDFDYDFDDDHDDHDGDMMMMIMKRNNDDDDADVKVEEFIIANAATDFFSTQASSSLSS